MLAINFELKNFVLPRFPFSFDRAISFGENKDGRLKEISR